MTLLWALLAALAVSLVSLVGVVLLVANGSTRRWVPLLVALAAGALLGNALLHLVPETVHALGMGTGMVFILVGVVVFFLIESLIHWHHHGTCDQHGGPQLHEAGAVASFGWMNVIGDGLHNLVDGALIGAAWIVGGPEVGIPTTIAVALHEIPQEFGDFGVLVHSGMSVKRALMWNLASALAAVVGVFFAFAMKPEATEYLLPIAAGGFIYVACVDLVPEIHRGQGSKLWTTLALIGGMLLVSLFPCGCGHSHDPSSHEHNQDCHDCDHEH